MTHAPLRGTATPFDAIVVGAGLAGLTAATTLARMGRRVLIVEQASATGGRSATHLRDGYAFNLGAHALYTGGPAGSVLRELGIEPRGRPASAEGGFALRAGATHTLPVGLMSLLTTGLLTLPAKLELARLLARLPRLDPAAFAGVSITPFLAEQSREPGARALLHALARLLTYTHDPHGLSAQVVLEQLRQANRGPVLYLDGGWQQLVDGLASAARAAGAHVELAAKVGGVQFEPVPGTDRRRVTGLLLADGRQVSAPRVVLAVSPRAASAMVDGGTEPSLHGWAVQSVPVRASCLDVALSTLPRPGARFGLGIDRPTYLSVHSLVARLAPEGGALVHTIRYLSPDDDAHDGGIEELEGVLDRLQPGWRSVLVARQELPSITVVHDSAPAARGGLAGRPGPSVPGLEGLFVAGDWVGPRGFLADAAFASGRDAALLAGSPGGAVALAA